MGRWGGVGVGGGRCSARQPATPVLHAPPNTPPCARPCSQIYALFAHSHLYYAFELMLLLLLLAIINTEVCRR